MGQIPTFLLAPFAGVWVDRWNRRQVLLATQALAMLQSLALAALTLTHRVNIHEILWLSVFQGVINAFDMPGRQSFLVQMVEDKKDLGNAIAINSSMVNVARLVGPALAGWLIAATNEGWCFLIDGASYLAVLASLLMMRIRVAEVRHEDTSMGFGEHASQSDRHQASEGDVLLTAQLLALFLSLLGAAVTLQLVQNVFPNLTVTTESGTITPFEDILKEVNQLNSVSDRLELLADQNPSVEDALMSVSGNVRNTATALEVLALIRTKAAEPKKRAPKQRRERYLM